MYHQVIGQCVKALRQIEVFLDKAERHAKARGSNVDDLLRSRLAPDMKNFIYQVQSASDYVKAGAAWLSGQSPPSYDDTETTVDELRKRIAKTVAFVGSIAPPRYDAASEQRVRLSWAKGQAMEGEPYLLQMVVPNVYFHVAMAYAILRMNGVDVGKMDYLGHVDFVATTN